MKLLDLLKASTARDYFTSRNGLLVPTGNLGISRSAMPQIKDFKRFEKVLGGYDIKIRTKRVRIGDISLTQNEINKDKVFRLMMEYRKANVRTRGGVNIPGFPPVLSSDNFVLDGSHRQVAMYNINKHAYQDYSVVDYPIRELYSLIKDNPAKFSGCVKYQGLME